MGNIIFFAINNFYGNNVTVFKNSNNVWLP